jgi:hypothetical protein
VNSNPLPNHASGNEGVNTLEIRKEGKTIMRVIMKRLYGMLRQVGYLKIPVKMQAVINANEYYKYH